VTPEKNPNADLVRPNGTLGTRRLQIPSIVLPTIPEMNIRFRQIVVPATPPIDVTVPAPPRRATRTRTIII
jgi:hypothetical protein